MKRTTWPAPTTLLALALGSLGACEGAVGLAPVTPTGEGGSASTTTTSSSTGEGGRVCVIPPDYWCNQPADCECLACSVSALCVEGGCLTDGLCYPREEDSCTCSDCDWDAQCLEVGSGQCNLDGTCDYQQEGCGCADCYGEPTCQDNEELCAGGAPDGVCDLLTDSCACSDCLGNFDCLCTDLTYCGACVCPFCWTDDYCSDPLNCLNDGLCEWDWGEGCQCVDCAGLSVCAGYP